MQAQSKRRSAQQRSPPGVSSRAAFDVRRAQAVSMMVQVGGLDRVHRAHHANAQRDIVRSVATGQTKGIVVGVVNLAESGQEKEECARARHDRKCRAAGRCETPRRQRSGKPRRGDQRFIDHLAAVRGSDPAIPRAGVARREREPRRLFRLRSRPSVGTIRGVLPKQRTGLPDVSLTLQSQSSSALRAITALSLNFSARFADRHFEHPRKPSTLYLRSPMFGSIAVPVLVLLALVVAAYALVRHHRRRSRDQWRALRDLNPVSGQWLSDYRRSRRSRWSVQALEVAVCTDPLG